MTSNFVADLEDVLAGISPADYFPQGALVPQSADSDDADPAHLPPTFHKIILCPTTREIIWCVHTYIKQLQPVSTDLLLVILICTDHNITDA